MRLHQDLAVIILAAGKGTRMKSDRAKALHKIGDKSMVVHVVSCACDIVGENVHVVVGHQADKVKAEVVKYFNVDFVFQEALLGTGDAVKTALPALGTGIQDVLVLCGDVPLIQKQTLDAFIKGHKNSNTKISVLATHVDDPTGYGRIVRDEDKNLVCIREQTEASEDEKKINLVNTGIYCFDVALIKEVIPLIQPDNNQDEYYLTDAIKIARKRSEKIVAIAMDDSRQFMGVNTLEQLVKAERFLHTMARPNELP